MGYKSDELFKLFLVYGINEKSCVLVLYRWIIKGRCLFLKNNGECSIHSEKPLSCKIYPLIIGLDDNTLRVSLACKLISKNTNAYQGDLSKIFSYEYPYSIKTYVLLKTIYEIATSYRFIREPTSKP